MKKKFGIAFAILMLTMASIALVSAGSLSSGKGQAHASPLFSSGDSRGSNPSDYRPTHSVVGTPGCFDPLNKESIPATVHTYGMPKTNPDFVECSKLHGDHVFNRYRDFANAIIYWDSFEEKPEASDGFNPVIATYKFNLERVLKR